MPEPRLMELCHGGGCGCKVSPAVLSNLLGDKTPPDFNGKDRLLVGNSSGDDCAAWLVTDDIVQVGTADFFMPVVDDPHDFGRIAATNALSDVYAMGAAPTFALALVGMPIDKISEKTITAILEGGKQACADAGIPVAGGHTIDTVEPIYGLAVNGLCTVDELCRNDTAKDGDLLILSKPLGVGILSAALRKDKLGKVGMEALLATTTKANSPGRTIAVQGLANSMTDVTGFGLLGHALEVCRGSGVSASLNWADIPVMPEALELVQSGISTGASRRNWQSYGEQASVDNAEQWQRDLLTDPQTSGGLLVSCPPEAADQAMAIFSEAGFGQASVIGKIVANTKNQAKIDVVF